MIRALIVDDEPLARRRIRRLLERSAGMEVIGECGDGASAIEAICARRPDLVFLDVQMPEMSGFDVVQRIGPDAMPVTIFITAYDEYALRAFDANAIDYLLKPIAPDRFQRAIQHARERIAGKLNLSDLRLVLAGLQHPPKYLDRLSVTENGRILLIDVNDIEWIEVSGNYARVHAKTRTHQIRQTLNQLEAKLNPRQFLRIHRSTIVNVRHVREIHPWFHGHHVVVLHNGQELRLSRYQRDVVKQLGL